MYLVQNPLHKDLFVTHNEINTGVAEFSAGKIAIHRNSLAFASRLM